MKKFDLNILNKTVCVGYLYHDVDNIVATVRSLYLHDGSGSPHYDCAGFVIIIKQIIIKTGIMEV